MSRLPGKAVIARGLWWAPLGVAVTYVLTLALQFNDLLGSTYLNADTASAPVIGQLLDGTTGHPQVFLGYLGWYSTLLFELATRWIPWHRQIWEGAPYAMALCSAGLVGWGAWRVAGRWAGAIALAIMICLGPSTLSLLLALNDHAPSWFTLALLGAFIVLLEQWENALSGAWLAWLAIAVGIVLGVNAASDVLLTVGGAVPFLLAAGGTWALHPSRHTGRAAAVALATGLVALVSGVVLHALMHRYNVVAAANPATKMLAGADAVGSHLKLWWQSIAVLGNGNFFGQTLGLSTALELACAAMTLATVVLGARTARNEIARALAGRLRGEPREDEGSVRVAWCLFWGSSLALLSAAFVLSAVPADLQASRYLVGIIYAAAALVPLLGSGRPLTRVAVTAGATLYAFTGWLALAHHTIGPPSSPTARLASVVADIAREEHVSVGYAGYWDAAPITWATHLKVRVYPVDDCAGNTHLCGFALHFIGDWYSPKPGMRTFLLSDPAYPTVPSAPTPDLGPPSAVHHIGPVTMYIYPYDIAARLYAL